MLEAFANDGQEHQREAVERLKQIAESLQQRRNTIESIIAHRGLVCSDCDAYVVTQADDLETLERLAQHAREAFGVEDATAETPMCDGCLTDNGRQIGYCATCEIRACAVERGALNCAHCPDCACEQLGGFLEQGPEARGVLDDIRASL